MILGLRKVQLTGGSHYIGIPQGWITANEIKKGQQLLIECDETGKLTISKNEGKNK